MPDSLSTGQVIVIGTGPGTPEWVPPVAVTAAAGCNIWFGSKEALAVMSESTAAPAVCIEMEKDVHASLDRLSEALTVGAGAVRAAVLVTGDPLVFSLFGSVRERFGRENVEVLPGVGSYQLALARLGFELREAEVASMHGRGAAGLRGALRSGKAVVCLTDPQYDAVAVSRVVVEAGEGERGVAVLSFLGRADEIVLRFESAHDLLRERTSFAGQPHVVFVWPRVPVTKPEVRAVVLSKLGLTGSSVVLDVGCGSGSVTEAIARSCPQGRVIAIDRDAEAVRSTRARLRASGVGNVEVVHGLAPDALRGELPAGELDAVFVGGTGGRVGELVVAVARDLRDGGRLVATSVTVGMPGAFIEAARTAGLRLVECLQMQVSRAEPAGDGVPLILRGENPVTIMVFTR